MFLYVFTFIMLTHTPAIFKNLVPTELIPSQLNFQFQYHSMWKTYEHFKILDEKIQGSLYTTSKQVALLISFFHQIKICIVDDNCIMEKKQKIKTITKSFHRKVESTTKTTNRWSGNATDFQQDFSQHVDTGLIIY